MAPLTRPILGKILINGTIKCRTGLHIGASQDNLEIGGLDKSVVRDPLTRKPYIPGSSLKGKMRSLLERKESLPFDREAKVGNLIRRHECDDPQCPVCRLFGAAGRKDEVNVVPRIVVRDSILTEESREKLEEIETALYLTEWKFENSLDRITSAANPRNLERVPSGAEFDLNLIYTVEAESGQVEEDVRNIFALLELIEDDCLGGHGSRGYGRVAFSILELIARRLDYYTALTDDDRSLYQEAFTVKNLLDCKKAASSIAAFFD